MEQAAVMSKPRSGAERPLEDEEGAQADEGEPDQMIHRQLLAQIQHPNPAKTSRVITSCIVFSSAGE